MTQLCSLVLLFALHSVKRFLQRVDGHPKSLRDTPNPKSFGLQFSRDLHIDVDSPTASSSSQLSARIFYAVVRGCAESKYGQLQHDSMRWPAPGVFDGRPK
jgi:hypothetical protein